MAFGGWVSISVPYYAFMGQLDLKYDWMEFLLPVGAFFMFGVALQGIAEVRALLKGERGSVEPDSVSGWWMNKVGCGLLIVVAGVAGVAAIVIAGPAVDSIFEGVSKGTAIIAVLLFCILLALLNLGSKVR